MLDNLILHTYIKNNKNSENNYNIAVSIGDINGIGLEVFIKSLFSLKLNNYNNIHFTLFFDKYIFINYFKKSNLFTEFLLYFQNEYRLNPEKVFLLKRKQA